MKTMRLISIGLGAATMLVATSHAQEIVTNRLTASMRFGLNISAKFKGTAGAPTPGGGGRTTPDGDAYNYDNGYVLTDVSGNFGGQTWYWGYDNSANQISGNTILMSRSTANGSFESPSFESDPQIGVEVTYDRHLGTWEGMNYGVEFAGNYMNISLHNSSTFTGNMTRVTDAYAFTPGTTPPGATPGNPYQGRFGDEGFLIGDAPVSTTTTIVPGGTTISGRRKLDGDLFGMRLGPYLDIPINEDWRVWFSGGLAMGYLSADASWADTITMPGGAVVNSAGNGSDTDFRFGYYFSANISWEINEDWSAVAGVQYQNLGTYDHDFGGRVAELDLSSSFFFTLGVSWKF